MPGTHTLTARGSDRIPAQLFDDHGGIKGTFSEMTYDTLTGRPSFKDFRLRAQQ